MFLVASDLWVTRIQGLQAPCNSSQVFVPENPPTLQTLPREDFHDTSNLTKKSPQHCSTFEMNLKPPADVAEENQELQYL